MSDYLGYEKGDPAGRGRGNNRNGYSRKTELTEDGEIDIAVPRDRNGTFEPKLVPKGERRLDYNTVRPHSAFGNVPPAVYANVNASEVQWAGALEQLRDSAPRPVALQSPTGSNEPRTLLIPG